MLARMRRRDFTTAVGTAMVGTLIADRSSPAFAAALPVPRVNGERLNAHLAAIAEYGKNPKGGVTRLAYSEPDLAARSYVKQLMQAANLTVAVDDAGNIYGRRAGSEVGAKPIIFGSHVDSVPEGGNFDGNVGVLGAIEVAQTLSERGIVTKHPLEAVVWQNEEGGTWGSHLITAAVSEGELASEARSGKSIREGVAYLGGDPDHLARSRRVKGSVHGYLELHIEQSGHLDREKHDIGVVEGIVAYHQWDVTVDGFANHAGTTAMNERRDALLSAARFIEAVNRVVRAEPGRQVGTVGRIQAFPGVTNVVPGQVKCTLELRDLEDAKVKRMYDAIRAEAERIGKQNDTTFAFHQVSAHESARCDERVRALIAASAKDLGLSTMSLPSGAGHDAQNLARICPMGMIFMPSVGGISHSPKEFSRAADITNGADVLLGALLRLDDTSLGTG